MLNKIDNSFRQTLTFNSVPGTLIKSANDSRFIRFHMNSDWARSIFNERKPTLYGERDEIEVLQVMLAGNDQFLVEFRMKDIK